MSPTKTGAKPRFSALDKAPSAVPGFDEITFGGLPRGRTSLICGAAGSGKTLFGMQFLVGGIAKYNEPGVFIAFEETEKDLTENVASLGFDIQELIKTNKLAMDYIRVEKSEFTESGAYNLDGLFLRIGMAIEAVGAKRVVIDTLESLFGGLQDASILRAELRRLFQWFKDQSVTAVVTGERGEGSLTRQGLEEYVSDCVILLDHRVNESISTRRLRVVKYRGSTHGTNEYPFLIDEDGFTVMPVTSADLQHSISNERITTGISRLDAMLGSKGYFRGSTILVSGVAGAGKSSLSAHFADASCSRGERCVIFAFEESPEQIKRNMRSIGIDLARHEAAGLLKFAAARPTMYGLETHLATMHKMVREFEPSAVVIDPVSSLLTESNASDVHPMAVRLIDYLKTNGITAFMTSLTRDAREETTEIAISSIIDTWILLRSVESCGERNRTLNVLKSRGMEHSNQVREFLISNTGVDLVDVYVGPHGVLTGSARTQQENHEKAQRIARERQIARRQRELERKRTSIELRLQALHEELKAQEAEMTQSLAEDQAYETQLNRNSAVMASCRDADEFK